MVVLIIIIGNLQAGVHDDRGNDSQSLQIGQNGSHLMNGVAKEYAQSTINRQIRCFVRHYIYCVAVSVYVN